MQEVFVLLADGDGTFRSTDTPFGVAVTTEAEAQRYVAEAEERDGRGARVGRRVGYSHSYEKVTIFEDKDKAINFAFHRKINDVS